jgi:glycosyltransferase involved in cell wall biosynthesis
MFADSFLAEGHEVRLLTTTKRGLEKEFKYDVIRQPSLLTVIKDIGWADIVFENNPCLRMAWPNFFLRKPQVTGLQTWIGQPGDKKSLLQKIKLKLVSYSNSVIACSESIRLNMYPKAIVIGNPYDNSKFGIKDQITRKNDFLFLGRLVSDKGVEIAINAFKNFAETTTETNVKLTIVGEGPERPLLEKLVNDYGLTNRVIFKGSLRGADLTNCLNEHKFLIVPSLWQEPFGIVALEGMACGCIPIVSEVGGLPEAVGNAGLTFKRADVNGLANVMLHIYNNTDQVKQLQNKAKAHLANHFIDTVAKRYLSVFTNAIKQV